MTRSLISPLALAITAIALLTLFVGAGAAEEITVDVTVVDQDGDPIGDVELTATWEDGEATATTTSGGAALIEVPEGEDIEIETSHPDFVRNHVYEIENASVPEGESRLAIEIPMSEWGTAAITVEEDGEPVEDAIVRVRDILTVETLSTDASGLAVSDRLEQGEYTFEIEKPEYLTEEITLTVDGNVSETVAIERARVTATFNVTDDHFDPPRPLEGATVELEGASLTTDSDGERSTDLRVNRDYDVTVSKEGYDSVTQSISVDESDARFNLSIQRTPELNLTAANQRVVVDETTRVTVLDEYGQPVANVTVSVNGEELAETDADGEATVTIDQSGENELSATVGDLSSTVTVEGVGDDGEPIETDDADEEIDDDPDEVGPGFGVGAVAIALLSLALLARHRIGRR